MPRVGQYRVPVRRSTPLDRAALVHFWHPEREGVEQAPPAFRHQLALIHRDLAAVRPPARAPLPSPPKWLIWYRKPAIRSSLCPGWLLLFIWPPHPYDPIPLDNRVLANLYMIDGRRFANGGQYFDHIVADMKAAQERRDKADKAARDDRNHDYWQSTQIKNIGPGNKFALHHDGTIIPSRSEQNWIDERASDMLPDAVVRERHERRKGRPG